MYCYLDGEYSEATIIDHNFLTCPVKAYNSLTTQLYKEIFLTLNKVDFVGPLTIGFVPEILVETFIPKVSSIN
jgi:hypothetical protein